MKRRAIKFIKEFRFEAYGEHVIPAGTDHRLPINHLRQAVITVGHGTDVYVPPEYFIRVKKPPPPPDTLPWDSNPLVQDFYYDCSNLQDKIHDLKMELGQLIQDSHQLWDKAKQTRPADFPDPLYRMFEDPYSEHFNGMLRTKYDVDLKVWYVWTQKASGIGWTGPYKTPERVQQVLKHKPYAGPPDKKDYIIRPDPVCYGYFKYGRYLKEPENPVIWRKGGKKGL